MCFLFALHLGLSRLFDFGLETRARPSLEDTPALLMRAKGANLKEQNWMR